LRDAILIETRLEDPPHDPVGGCLIGDGKSLRYADRRLLVHHHVDGLIHGGAPDGQNGGASSFSSGDGGGAIGSPFMSKPSFRRISAKLLDSRLKLIRFSWRRKSWTSGSRSGVLGQPSLLGDTGGDRLGGRFGGGVCLCLLPPHLPSHV